jgi:succinoglycan biosynthesis transport protein ExoP
MSRNFELLMQLQKDPEAPAERFAMPPDSAFENPAPSSREMLHLARSIFHLNNGRPSRQIVFCGVDEENGSSSVCAGTARALENTDAKSVCLVDANVVSNGLARSFGVDTSIPHAGKNAPIREHCTQLRSNLWLAGTDLLTNGRGALLSGADLKTVLQRLEDSFEYVLIDAPALKVNGDALIIGQIVNAVVLVIEADRTRRLSALRVKETLEAAGVHIVGTVLRDRSFPLPERLYNKF